MRLVGKRSLVINLRPEIGVLVRVRRAWYLEYLTLQRTGTALNT